MGSFGATLQLKMLFRHVQCLCYPKVPARHVWLNNISNVLMTVVLRPLARCPKQKGAVGTFRWPSLLSGLLSSMSRDERNVTSSVLLLLYSKAPVTTSVALVPSSFLLWSGRGLKRLWEVPSHFYTFEEVPVVIWCS